jgi:hypothetical protein
MSDPGAVSVGPEEMLARFIMVERDIRDDRTVRHNAFMPPPDGLSVTRHVNLSENDLWRIGRDAAGVGGRTLYGRADVAVFVFLRHSLRVIAEPVPNNPNHANVIDWPTDKSSRRMIATLIAASAGKVRDVPPESN